MTPEEKRARAARKHVRRAVADTLEGLGLLECVAPMHRGHSTKDFTAAKKAFKELIREIRKGA